MGSNQKAEERSSMYLLHMFYTRLMRYWNLTSLSRRGDTCLGNIGLQEHLGRLGFHLPQNRAVVIIIHNTRHSLDFTVKGRWCHDDKHTTIEGRHNWSACLVSCHYKIPEGQYFHSNSALHLEARQYMYYHGFSTSYGRFIYIHGQYFFNYALHHTIGWISAFTICTYNQLPTASYRTYF